ncbi:hypothetical protein DRO61_01230 [Candidatus Bathyarchaeota archaeon]|jgi:hypothetical protein|nr:MAG: hypothetical protein DRO61_01230 [Candidatus Bathyarchaeota archaeon]
MNFPSAQQRVIIIGFIFNNKIIECEIIFFCLSIISKKSEFQEGVKRSRKENRYELKNDIDINGNYEDS